MTEDGCLPLIPHLSPLPLTARLFPLAPRSALRAALLLGLASSALQAQAPSDSARPDSASSLQALRVRAAYTPRVIGSASAVSIALDSAPLGVAAPTMGEMLRRLPFLYVRQNSRGEQELSVRGSESRQAAVFFEGVPLTLTWDARADVSTVPMAGAQRLDYVRGLSSLLAGPNAIGGVLSVSLWEDHDPARAAARVARAELQADQFGGARSALTWGGALKHSTASSLQFRVGAGWRELPGLARPSSISEPGGNEALRVNTDARAVDAFAGLRYEQADGRYLSGFATFSDGARGVAPELHIADPRRWRNPELRRRIAGVSAGTGALRSRLGIGDAEISLGLNDGLVEINSFSDATYANVSGRELGEDRTATLRITFDQQLGERVVLRGAYTQSSVRYFETVETARRATYRQRLSSLASELDLQPTPFLTLSAGLSQDAADSDEAGNFSPLGPRTGLGWRGGATWIAPSLGMRVHASASTRKRFPALRELYSGGLNRFDPNPALVPETAASAELGLGFIREAVDVQAVVFRQRIDDVVVRVTVPSNRFRRLNRDRFTSQGVELTAGAAIGRASLRADVTLQRARIEDPSLASAAQRMPEDVPNVFGSIAAVMPLARGLEAQTRVRALGATRCSNPDSGELESQAGAGAVDVGVERRWTAGRVFGRVSSALQLENAFDAAIYDKCGLPQAGRTLRLTLRVGG